MESAELWHEAWPKVKVYEDKPVTQNFMVEQKYGGKKEFKLAIVPFQEGALELGPLMLSYFDPVERSYKTLATPPVKLGVAKGEDEKLSHVTAQRTVGDEKKDIKVLGSDLMPAKERIVVESDALGTAERVWLLALMTVSPFGYLGALWHHRRRIRIRADQGYLRRERAHKVLKSRLAKVATAAKPYQEASLALRCYLGDKFDFDGGAMTPVDTARLLAPRGITKAAVERINTLLMQCDEASYGGGAAVGKDELGDNIRELVKLVDKEARNER